jgi:uroporphyrinogen III methyltransferase / synthase
VADLTASTLAGKRVVVTRAALQSSELFEQLRSRGAVPVLLPLVSIAPPEDYAPLDAALRQLQSFDWIIFTSANAVNAVASRCKALGIDVSAARLPQIAVVGPATEREAESSAFSVSHVAKTHLGVALAQELSAEMRDQSVLLPRSDRAKPDLPAALRRFGARLTEVVAYRTLPPSEVDREKAAAAAAGDFDAILFYSSSAVDNFTELLGRESLRRLQEKVIIAAVGPVTAAALREAGIQRIVVAADTTSAAVVAALESHFAQRPKRSTAGANLP